MNDEIGDRMKEYESPTQNRLMKRTPTIIRIDGKAFHTYTRDMKSPMMIEKVHQSMVETTKFLCANIQNAVLGYTQSDEISILLNDWKKFKTDQWFGGNVQKITSVSASFATAAFNVEMWGFTNKTAFFDSRVFNLPKEEVRNYFLWREMDCRRNSVMFLARKYFSHKEISGMNVAQIKAKLREEKDITWEDSQSWFKNGSIVYREPENRGWKSSGSFLFSPYLTDEMKELFGGCDSKPFFEALLLAEEE